MERSLFFLLFFFIFCSCKKKEEYCSEGLKGLSIIAHRGVATRTAENSLQAIRQAIYLNLDAVEFDLQISKDGEFVLFHDIDLFERTGKKGRIADYSVAELKQIRLRNSLRSMTDQTIPTLREVLKEVGSRIHCFIDLKTSSKLSEENLVSILDDFGPSSQFTILSFDNNVLLRLYSLDSSLRLCLLLYDEASLFSNKNDFSHLTAFGLHYSLSNKLVLETLKKKTGVNYIYMYTVNSINDIAHNDFRWLDGIITDNPEDWMLFRANCP